jgi:hypothetical protein
MFFESEKKLLLTFNDTKGFVKLASKCSQNNRIGLDFHEIFKTVSRTHCPVAIFVIDAKMSALQPSLIGTSI